MSDKNESRIFQFLGISPLFSYRSPHPTPRHAQGIWKFPGQWPPKQLKRECHILNALHHKGTLLFFLYLFSFIYSFSKKKKYRLTHNSDSNSTIGSALGFNLGWVGPTPPSLRSTQMATNSVILLLWCLSFCELFSNHQGATPLVLAKRRGVNKDVIRLLESLEEQEVKGFNRGTHSKLETMQTAESERYLRYHFVKGQVTLNESFMTTFC